MESRSTLLRANRLCIAAVIGGVLALAGCATKTVDDVARHDWIEVRGEHFVMMTDIAANRAARLVQDLEAFREYLVVEHPESFPDDASPVRILAFGNGAAFQLIVDQPHLGGGFQQTYRGDYAIADLSLRIPDGRFTIDPVRAGRGSIVPIYVYVARYLLHHEFVEYALSGNETRRYPLWFREGYAEYLSTFRVVGGTGDPTSRRKALIGELPRYRLSLVQKQQWMPWEALLAARSYDTGYPVDLFYAQSWLLVHYLMSRPEGKERLGRYLALINDGERAADTLMTVFEMTREELHRALRAYARREKFPLERTTLEPSTAWAIHTRPMAVADVRFELGYVQLHFGGDQAVALGLFEQSLINDPANTGTRAELLKLYLSQGRSVEAAKLIEEGLALGAPNADLLTAQGHLSVHHAVEAVRAGRPDWYRGLKRARVAFQQAIVADPAHAEAYLAFGQSFLADAVVPQAALLAVERARDLLPSNVDILFILARLHLNNKNLGQAAALFHEVVNWSRRPDMISRSRMFLQKISEAGGQASAEQAADPPS